MRRSIYGIIAITLFGVVQARADENVERNKMVAASAILSDTMLLAGHINIESGDSARFDSIIGGVPGEEIHFEKINACVYAAVQKRPNEGRYYSIIDFSKLDGSYQQNGVQLSFRGEDNAACVLARGYIQKGCFAGVNIPNTRHNPQRIIDNTAYILRNGCGGGNPKPY